MIRKIGPRALVAILLLVSSGAWQGCARRPLAVEYAGCWQVRLPGPICVLGRDREIRLWAPVEVGEEVELQAGGRRLEAPGRPVAGGRQWLLKIPPEADSVEVRAQGERGSRAWKLRFGPKVKDTGLALHGQAGLKLSAQDYAAAQNLLEQARQIHSKAGLVRNEAYDLATLVHTLIQVRDFEKARRALEDLARLESFADAPAETLYLLQYHRGLLSQHVGDARNALAALEEAATVAKRLGLVGEWYGAEEVRARQLQSLGRSREAGAIFESLERESSPMIRPCDRAGMRVNRAWSLILAREAGEAVDVGDDPVPILEEADEIARREGCARSEEKRRSFHLNRALANFQAHRLKEARSDLKLLAEMAGEARPLDQIWSLDLGARLDLADRDPRGAQKKYEELEKRADRWALPEGRWRAAVGRALCLEELHRTDEALGEYDRAEALVDGESLQIPIQAGRDTFVAQRRKAIDQHIDLLLRLGNASEALVVVRRDRSRVLRELERADRFAHLSPREQEGWDLLLAKYQAQRSALDEEASGDRRRPADERRQNEERRRFQLAEAERALDEAWGLLGPTVSDSDLPSLRSGELVLAYRPLGERWVGFAADSREVKAVRFDIPSLAAGSPDRPEAERARLFALLLLAPFETQIERAERVRVLPLGDLRSVDFHALPLPFGRPGRILLDRGPVVYGLDLARAPDKQEKASGLDPASRRALTVGDPGNNLPAAYQEAREVARALRAWKVEPLLRKAAKRDAVLAALARADLLHYAGHGEVSGFGGWESELPLAGGSHLTLSDLLILKRAPAWVVLSGCETGRSGSEAPVEGVSLAHAFLLAGSREAIASTRKVEDAEARALFADLYGSWDREPDLAALLRGAQLRARGRHAPESAWASFRVFEP